MRNLSILPGLLGVLALAACEAPNGRPATAAERAAWWPDASGIPPGSGVGLVDAGIAPPDLTLKGLQCLRGLWTGEGTDADRVRAGIAATRAAPLSFSAAAAALRVPAVSTMSSTSTNLKRRCH